MDDDELYDPYNINYASSPSSQTPFQVNNDIDDKIAAAEAEAALQAQIQAQAEAQAGARQAALAAREREHAQRFQNNLQAEAEVEAIELAPVIDAPGNPLFAGANNDDIMAIRQAQFDIAAGDNQANAQFQESCCELDDFEYCCGCRGFYCIEGIAYTMKYFLQSAALTLIIFVMVYIAGNSRPFEDSTELWSRTPFSDILAMQTDMTDVYCPPDYDAYRRIGADSYTSGSGKSSNTYTDIFYVWKKMRFCTKSDQFSTQPYRVHPDPTTQKCQSGYVLCGGACYEGSQCPVMSISITSSPRDVPTEGVSWLHHETLYTLSYTRIPQDTTESIAPLIGFSSSVSFDNPPVKCIQETESSKFTHKLCTTPNPQYTLIDEYNYSNTNNARLFYTDNQSSAYRYTTKIEAQTVGFYSRPELLLLPTCTYSYDDITHFNSYTTAIFRTNIANVVFIGMEYLAFLMAAPVALIYACDNDNACCLRCTNASHLYNFFGFILSLVVLIYSVLLQKHAGVIAAGSCFDETGTAVFVQYEKDITRVITFIIPVLAMKGAMILFDFVYVFWKTPCSDD